MGALLSYLIANRTGLLPGVLRHNGSRVFREILDDAPLADETPGGLCSLLWEVRFTSGTMLSSQQTHSPSKAPPPLQKIHHTRRLCGTKIQK